MSDQMQFASHADQQPLGGDVSAANANNAQDAPLTRAEIEKMVDDRAAKQFQALQSMQSKTEARLRKEQENRLAALQASGVTLTPEQANRVFQETEKQFKLEAEDKSQPAQAGYPGQAPSNQPPMHPIDQAAYELMKAENVFAEEGDPEIQLIDRTTKNPRVYLNSVQAFIDAKKERLTRPRGMPSASPSMTATGGNAGANTLEAQYQKEFSQLKRGDGIGLVNLKRKYREKGLPV